MSSYIVTQDGPKFEVRIGGASGQVVATFSNRFAAEKFVEQQQGRDEASGSPPSKGRSD
jgi:hypothetical protein